MTEIKNIDNVSNNSQKNFMLPVDFHCHSTYSDGSYSIEEVLNMAKANGGKYIAITDHDTVNGVAKAREYAKSIGLNFFGGVEISVTWEKNNLVHIVGLNIDENNKILVDNLNNLRSNRFKRGEKIAEKLEKAGIPNALEGAMKYCNSTEALSRTHFMRFLVDSGYAKASNAFDKYLAPGKVAYVPQTWASLEDAIKWITDSGGIAIIAHPSRYKFTRTKLLRLIDDFKQCGGRGIEVISSSHSKEDANNIAIIANNHDLLCSMGSDFHTIETFRTIKVGINHPLPNEQCKPIYTELGIKHEDLVIS
ncbi:MAG: phosphatase [Burkholderiales bacterium]|jgi:predicted metal-dependent phosphoesterase TrpH|nr:phosphatase [Burkholderiales bacterium]